MEMNVSKVNCIVDEALKESNYAHCLEIEERLYYIKQNDEKRVIAGLIYLYDMEYGQAKLYKDMIGKFEKEIQQLKENLSIAQAKNDSLVKQIEMFKSENRKLSQTLKGYLEKNQSYRSDVDDETITLLLEKGYSKGEVARRLGVSRQTIYRRLKETK